MMVIRPKPLLSHTDLGSRYLLTMLANQLAEVKMKRLQQSLAGKPSILGKARTYLP